MALAQINPAQPKEKKPSILERAFKGIEMAGTVASVAGKIPTKKNPLESYSKTYFPGRGGM